MVAHDQVMAVLCRSVAFEASFHPSIVARVGPGLDPLPPPTGTAF